MHDSSQDSFVLPTGFRFSGVACGIKSNRKQDLTLVVGDGPLTAAGVYTKNQIVAAPVTLCRQRTPEMNIRALVINSGNANACTGQQGLKDANETCQFLATQIECKPEQILIMSTGVIGQTLPMEKIKEGIVDGIEQLGKEETQFLDAACGILTTDKSHKVASRTVEINGHSYRITGMAKGAGMIAPNMATMLAVLMTDAPLNDQDAQHLLVQAVDDSFNRISVDGHTSTNDSVVLLSSGEPSSVLLGNALEAFSTELRSLCVDLAKQIPADGEGATHVLELVIRGASSDTDADTIARAVGASPLVKTAITGGDPNWGRIVSAAGYAGPTIDPDKTQLQIMGTTVFRAGGPIPFDAAELSQRMNGAATVKIDLLVGEGSGSARFWASDLTVDYVRFNAEYTT